MSTNLNGRVERLERRNPAENKPLLVVYPVDGKPGFYADSSGREYERGGPDWPKDRTILRIEYNR